MGLQICPAGILRYKKHIFGFVFIFVFRVSRSVVELLIEMLEPYKGRVLDPCCGSDGMFVQSEKFVLEHQGRINDISIYGQESNQTTWRLAKMNLAICGIDSSQVQWNNEGSFLNDAHKDLKA
jgi:type I restriction enzyme M protein